MDMNATMPSWEVKKPCSDAVLWLEQRLTGASLRYLRTFDLQDARLAAGECPCPHHGAAECDCQMVVVLVYAEASPPVTLVVHGNNGQSWVSMVDRPDQRADPKTLVAIGRALRVAAASVA